MDLRPEWLGQDSGYNSPAVTLNVVQVWSVICYYFSEKRAFAFAGCSGRRQVRLESLSIPSRCTPHGCAAARITAPPRCSSPSPPRTAAPMACVTAHHCTTVHTPASAPCIAATRDCITAPCHGITATWRCVVTPLRCATPLQHRMATVRHPFSATRLHRCASLLHHAAAALSAPLRRRPAPPP